MMYVPVIEFLMYDVIEFLMYDVCACDRVPDV